MKYTLINILILFFLSGCTPSNDLQKEASAEPFFEATFLGNTYSNYYKDGFASYSYNCITGEMDLRRQSIGRIELPNLSLQANFAVPRLLSNWESKGDIPASRVIGNQSRRGCNNPFDLEIYIYSDNENEAMDISSNFNRIEKVLFISEDSETANYMFEGNFMVSFRDENGLIIAVDGKYTIPVVLNKN